MANIGENIGGGIFFYSGATFGLVAATKDIHIPVDWGFYGTEVPGTSTVIGSGLANTTLIANLSGYTAAWACNSLILSGQSDWYLPSKDELNELYTQKEYVSGLDVYNNYWSSSQSSKDTAWMQYFLSGAQSSFGYTNQSYKVRPIRTL